MNGAIFFFFYYILFAEIIDNSKVLPWWDQHDLLLHWVEILLNTLPFVTMIVEYPCNQIPFDWRMLPFDLGLHNKSEFTIPTHFLNSGSKEKIRFLPNLWPSSLHLA
jgi:hypothetical protein